VSTPPATTVTTTGTGSARAVPDVAVVRVAVVFRAAGVADALAGVDSAVRAAGAVARRHSTADRISSLDLSVWPHHDHQGRPAGFEARHGLAIVCPDLTAAGVLLGDLADEVGDRLRVEGIALELADPAPLRVTAREAAYADARARAGHLASLAGRSLGEVAELVEGAARGVSANRAPHDAVMEAAAIEPGETTVEASVTVTWTLT
jgi:uncharacterized protein YggE